MAGNNESDQERSLPASERRLEQAREEGRVPRSRALSHLAVIGAASTVVWLGGDALLERYSSMLASGLRFDARTAFDVGAAGVHAGRLVIEALVLVLPVMLVIGAAGSAAALGIGGWNLTLTPVAPDLTKLDPIAGLARVFSLRSLADVLKVAAESVLLVAVMALFLWQSVPQFADLLGQGRPAGVVSLVQLVLVAGLMMTLALTAVVVIDVPIQLWRHYQSMRMTLDEARRESRESDGDPLLRGRIRTLQREMARRRMMEEVPEADVVVTNPTHYAIALSYRDATDPAPRVVAKGAENVAARIREVAQAHRVPVLESPALARALFRHAEIGDPIPRSLYEAVAQVLAYVFRLRSATGALAAEAFAPVEIPPGLDPFGETR